MFPRMIPVPVQAKSESVNNSHHNTPPTLAVVLSLVLAVAFIAAVLVGARILSDRTTYKAAAVSPVLAPEAESAQCSSMTESLPDKLGRFKKVDIVDPAPAGTAAYRDPQGVELTFRCGVNAPDQYTVLSETHEENGMDWLTVTDATPGSSLKTFYQVGGSPVVAVTTEAEIGDALGDISQAVTSNVDEKKAPKPQPFPLSETSLEDGGHAQQCRKFLSALPETIGEYRSRETSHIQGAPSQSHVWLAPNREPVVVRCGVELPDSYEAGATLNQVDEIPWFAEPGLAEGSTSGHWYALGREAIVALYMPGVEGNEVVTALSQTIQDAIPPEEKSR